MFLLYFFYTYLWLQASCCSYSTPAAKIIIIRISVAVLIRTIIHFLYHYYWILCLLLLRFINGSELYL